MNWLQVHFPLNTRRKYCSTNWGKTGCLGKRLVPLALTHWGRDKMAATLADDTFICKFVNENILISKKKSLKFIPKGPINNISALVRIMAWRRPGDKPSSEPMFVFVPTHICVTRPQWVKHYQVSATENPVWCFPNTLLFPHIFRRIMSIAMQPTSFAPDVNTVVNFFNIRPYMGAI